MRSKRRRTLFAAVTLAGALAALFAGCGLSTSGTATQAAARCTTPAQCDDGNPCTVEACSADGTCSSAPVPDGDAAPSLQKAGDCKRVVCTAGALATVNDDADVSDDGSTCTTDACASGTPTHEPKATGTACTKGEANGQCDDAGACVVVCGNGLPPCDDHDRCTKDTCDLAKGTCLFAPLDDGPIPGATDAPGDCRKPVCVGGKEVPNAIDDTDVPKTASDCDQEVCTQGVPSNPPIAAGQACSAGGGRVCDGQGACVACDTEADCTDLPPSDACQTRTCDKHACSSVFVAKDTPVPTQTPGDCQSVVCDGAGKQVSKADDTDVPVDNNPCTQDVCTSGVPSNPPVPLDPKVACGNNSFCDGAGNCIGCNAPADCGGASDACKTVTCKSHVCGLDYAAAGTALPAAQQKAGDCQVLQCDGSGNTGSVPDDADLPVDGNDCTQDVCTAGVPSNPPLAVDTACKGGVCTAAGACVACNHADQCPAPALCMVATCDGNACGTTPAPAGLAPAASQTPKDCKDVVCDGAGKSSTVPDTGDLPDDGNACTADTCSAQGVPTFTPLPAHTACAQNGGTVCDGKNPPSCVGCIDNTDCTLPATCTGAPKACACVKATCASLGLTCGSAPDGCGGTLSCDNGKKDPNETAVDCGGDPNKCATRCPFGQKCAAGTDCAGGFCVDGVCCNSACGGGVTNDCQACSKAAGAAVDGTCGPTTGNGCDDGNACTTGDKCAAGTCTGTPKNCDDNNSCTTDSCVGGTCFNTPDLQLVGQACGAPSCQGPGTALPAPLCGVDGSCAVYGSTACAPYQCANGACGSCSDGIKNGDELGVDCGGSQCKLCSGQTCNNWWDCKSNVCNNNQGVKTCQ
jgi:hypothetical protein